MSANNETDTGPVTINRLVSYNVRRARLRRGWKQDELADALNAASLGRWSPTTVSAAERSMVGGRVKIWSANELVALTQVFALPVAYFFLPPDESDVKRLNAAPGDLSYTVVDATPPVDAPTSLTRSMLVEALEPRESASDYVERVKAEATLRSLEWTPGRYVEIIDLNSYAAFKQLTPEQRKSLLDEMATGASYIETNEDGSFDNTRRFIDKAAADE